MTRFHASRIAWISAVAVAAMSATATVATSAAAATTTYTITDLGSLGAGVTEGLAINASGQVTGDSVLSKQVQVPCDYPQQQKCFANPDHAFFWSNGTMTDLGTLGGLNSQGVAINHSGAVVGSSLVKPGEPSTQFLSNGRDHKLLALSGMTFARGINDSGLIAGQCGDVVAPEVFACVVGNGTITDLPNSLNGVAVAINNNGQALCSCYPVVGNGFNGDNKIAVVFTNGTPTDLGTLGGGSAAPTAINNNGQVVGTSNTSTGAFDGALWSNGTITDLGPSFSPAAINDSGVIVGGQFVYSNGTLQNLNTLIPPGSPYQIQSATGINDNGQIVANAKDTATGQTHALLLNPS